MEVMVVWVCRYYEFCAQIVVARMSFEGRVLLQRLFFERRKMYC